MRKQTVIFFGSVKKSRWYYKMRFSSQINKHYSNFYMAILEDIFLREDTYNNHIVANK